MNYGVYGAPVELSYCKPCPPSTDLPLPCPQSQIHKSKHTKNEAMIAITNKKDENSRIGLKEVHLGGVMAPSQGGHRKELRAL
jgi:hypothetical protein